MQVSFFKGGIKNTTPTKHAPIVGILEAIKNGFWKTEIETLRLCSHNEFDELKKTLPYFTASGTFSQRKDEALIAHSGLIQIDIDKLTDAQIEDISARVITDPYIYASFLSPSGRGLKMLVKILPKPENHLYAFCQLTGYFLGKYQVKIDQNVKALSMPFYVSYDPMLYLNPNSQLWII